MSATVTTDRRVGAFSAPAGKTIYVMFEETYEKNVRPYTPRWSCVGIGELDDVIRSIYARGSDCEGGMLQSRSGSISPEGYIRSWFSELEAPREMRDFDVKLKVGTEFYSTIQKDKLDAVSSMLTAISRTDILTALLQDETVTLSFQKNSDVVLALYGLKDRGKALLSPWLIVASIRRPQIEDDRNASLGYHPKPAKAAHASAAYPVVVRVLCHDECFIQQPDGSLRPAGRPYNIVEEFISNLWKEEIEFPRTFSRRIKAFREHVESGRRLAPELLRVIVDTAAATKHEWQAKKVVEFKRELASEEEGTVFKFQPTSENFYRILQLPDAAVRWEIKEDLLPTVPAASAMSAMQASLF
jgi:hypothetical protein